MFTEQDKFLDATELAYDLGSCGLGVMYHSAQRYLETPEPFPSWVEDSILGKNSNYLFQQYVLGWMGQELFRSSRPVNLNPYAGQHLRLIQAVVTEFDALEKMNHQLPDRDFREYISLPDDIVEKGLPDLARERNILKGYNLSPERVEILIQEGVDDYLYHVRSRKAKEMVVGEKFLEAQRRAVLYKLGGMLAVTEQVTFDAYKQGFPISADFKPQKKHEWWKRLFEEPLPNIEQLYEQAFAVFAKHMDPQNPTSGYLLDISKLPYLER